MENKNITSIFSYFKLICLLSILNGCATIPAGKNMLLKMPNGFSDNIFERKKMSIAVLDFKIPEEISNLIQINPSQRLVTMLAKTKKFDIVEREKINNILQEQKFSLSDLIDETKAIEVGKLLGAQSLVFGTIISLTQSPIDKFSYILYETKANVDLRVVDCSTGKILITEQAQGIVNNKTVYSANGELISGSKSYPGSYAEAVLKSIEVISQKISGLFPQTGYVVSVNDDQVIIDLGQDNGVILSQTYIVFRKIKDILHPITNEKIGFEKEVVAAIKITNIEKNLSVCSIIKIQNNNIVKPGDFVILKTD